MDKIVKITKTQTKKKLLSTYKELMKAISSLGSTIGTNYHDLFWNIRANLELTCVELKFLLKKPYQSEKWQKDFLKKITLTRSLKVAKERLNKINKNPEELQELFEKNLEECYQYVWKVKELISSTLNAFPAPEIIKVNGKYKVQNQETFEL